MGLIGGQEDSGEGIGFPLRELSRVRGRPGISGLEAVGLPALLIDGMAISLFGLIAGTGYQIIAFQKFNDVSIYAGTGFLVAVLFCGTTRLLSANHGMSVSHDLGRARLALIAWVMTFIFLIVVAFSLKVGEAFSRGAIFSFFLAGMPLVVATRVFVPRLLARTLYANAYRGSEVIVAAPRGNITLAHISTELRARGCGGIHVVEFDAASDPVDWPTERQRLLRRMIDTARVAGPGEIYVLAAAVPQERIASIMAGLRLVPRAVYVVPDDSVANLLGLPVRHVGPAFAIEMQKVPLSAFARGIKRAIDVVVASCALIFIAPAFAAMALAIKIDSSGPIFFRQRRNGYRGRQFRILKFRTMTVLEDGDAITQVQRNDQRVTRVGRWLRKTSFDELPQLINILRGEMSLVGPRPHAVAHDELYAKLIENHEVRQHVKPGVTGWAQVNGLRGETPTVDLMFRRIEYDLWYAANCTVMLDIQILVRTVFTVLRQNNAY